jgi:hypothetical protein
MNLPLLGSNAGLATGDRVRVVKVADAALRYGKDLSGGDVHVLVIGLLNAIGYAIARAEPPVAEDFVTTSLGSVPLYINAYRQDGHRGRFSQDT